MKVLHVLKDSIPLIGGYTSRSKYIVSNQKKMGITPLVVTSVRQGPTRSGLEVIDNISYYRSDLPRMWARVSKVPGLGLLIELLVFFKRILWVTFERKPDVIHAHSPVLYAIPALLAAKWLNIPFVYEIRAFWEDASVASGKFEEWCFTYRVIRIVETTMCKCSSRIIAIASGMKEDLISRGIPEKKIFIVPNGVDLEVFSEKNRHGRLRLELGLDSKVVFGFIGTFFDFEGIDDLVDAFRAISQRENDAALVLVGGGEREVALKEKIGKYHSNAITLVGKVPHDKILDYYDMVDVMVYPRKKTRLTELTTPLKPLEAMALGKPILCSSVGGLIELVGPQNALFFPPEEKGALLDCCMELLKDPSRRKQMGDKAFLHVLKERNWSKIVEIYHKIYDFGA